MAFDALTFARAMKSKRAEKGWNQQELADASGVSINSIARYEACKNIPTITQVVDIADALECSLDELCGMQASGA